MAKYVPYSKVKQSYQVSSQTVRGWAVRGQIRYKTIQNANRKTWLYDIESIGKFIDQSSEATQQESQTHINLTILYCRVSSRKQIGDLERQKELLSKAFPGSEIISDVGSGLNYNRPGFSKLVRKILRGGVSQVVVTFKDRLLRFGFALFKQICDENSTKLVVYGFGENGISEPHSEAQDDSELKEDLLSIVNVFVARNNGKRAAYLRKQRELQARESGIPGTPGNSGKTQPERNSENQAVSKSNSEETIEQNA